MSMAVELGILSVPVMSAWSFTNSTVVFKLRTAESPLTLHAGCIPVFIGPPYNTMPLARDVDYADIGVHFNITNTSTWMGDEPMHWHVDLDHAPAFAQLPHWWKPDANLSTYMIQVKCDVLLTK